VLLVLGSITLYSGPQGGNSSTFASGCIRAGLFLGALWLALPQILSNFRRAPRWLMGFFVKSKASPTQSPEPVVKQPRPRRRSNS
jgi:hypothetical protein